MAQDTDGTRSGDAKAEWNSMVNTKSLFLDLDEHHNTKEDKSGTAAFDERIKQALAGVCSSHYSGYDSHCKQPCDAKLIVLVTTTPLGTFDPR